jgi:hypothetical protein
MNSKIVKIAQPRLLDTKRGTEVPAYTQFGDTADTFSKIFLGKS